MKDFLEGIRAYYLAWQLISARNLWFYLLIPGIISLVLGSSIFGIAYLFSDDIQQIFVSLYPAHWIGGKYISKIASALSWILLLLTGFLLYRSFLMVVIAPFMSPLSMRVQAAMTGIPVFESAFFSMSNAKLMLRGMQLSIRNLVKEIFYTILLLLLGFIPIVNFVSPILIFLVQSFYAGFGNMDYTLERFYNAEESKKFSQENRGLVTGNGVLFLLLLMIPIAGLFLAPALSTAAATISSTKRILKINFN